MHIGPMKPVCGCQNALSSAPPQLILLGTLSSSSSSMSKTDHDSDSDVSELDAKELSQAVSTDQWAPMLGYCEDPETPLTADTFPSKSGGRPVRLSLSFNPTTIDFRLSNVSYRHG